MPYADPEVQRRFQREWIAARRREWIEEHGPCIDCGTWNDLQVDHADASTKVTHRVWSWSKERRAAELAKCVVRCAPCHLAKTRANGEGFGGRQGSSHHRAILTEDDVRFIRSSDQTGYALAKLFGINSGAITNIRKRRTWKHVV